MEWFLSYVDFPWFKRQPAEAIANLVEESQGHFDRPALDFDLTEEIIEHPKRFPLKLKGASEGS